jgi:hypothetical protein
MEHSDHWIMIAPKICSILKIADQSLYWIAEPQVLFLLEGVQCAQLHFALLAFCAIQS